MNFKEASHFTKEMLIESMVHLRTDLQSSLDGKADDERAKSRLAAARAMGLHTLAPEAIAVIDRAIDDVRNLQWPGGLDVRYLSLASALTGIARASAEATGPKEGLADLTALAAVMARTERATASRLRATAADKLRGLVVIIDPELTDGRDPAGVAKQVIAGGASALVLRDNINTPKNVLALAQGIAELCTASGVALLVHSQPDVAVMTGAEGIHLGRTDVSLMDAQAVARPWQLVGNSVGSADEARSAIDAGADHFAVRADSLPEVRAAVHQDGPPVLAVGASPEEAGQAHANGIVAAGDVTGAPDPQAIVTALIAAFNGAK